jgi:hypothetical protein
MEIMSPDWIAPHYRDAESAFATGAPFKGDAGIEIINLIRSFVTSLIAGYMAALVAGEYRRSTLALGIVLVVVGIVLQGFAFWNLAPAWFHVLFVLGLLPMTILGGKLRRPN